MNLHDFKNFLEGLDIKTAPTPAQWACILMTLDEAITENKIAALNVKVGELEHHHAA